MFICKIRISHRMRNDILVRHFKIKNKAEITQLETYENVQT